MVTLQYDIAKLINRVNTNALLIGRNVKQERTNDFMQLGVQDAEDFIKDKIRSICGQIFADFFSQYGRDLVDENNVAVEPYEFDVTYNNVAGRIVFRMLFPEGFNLKLIPAILQATEDLIIEYVTYEWLYHTNYDYRKAEAIYQKWMDKLIGIVSRRNGVTLRNYKYY